MGCLLGEDQIMKPSVVRLLLPVGILLPLLVSIVLSGSSSSALAADRPVPGDADNRGEELLVISTTSTDKLIASPGGEADVWSKVTREMEEGIEEEEEEWMKKRVMAEEESAHLDYIYTQRHSHP